MRGNGRCHTDRDTVRAVYEQIGESRRQHDGLFARVVEVGIEINRLFVDVADHFKRDFGKTCFGITICRRRIAVDRTEVAVSVDKRATDRKILRKTHHCVVNGAVAVGMVFTKHFTDDHSALTIGLVGSQSELAHCVKNASVNRFQTVSYVGDCTGHVDRHRICDKGLFKLAVDFNVFDGGVGYMLNIFVVFVVSYVRHNCLLIRRDRSRVLRFAR